MRKKSKRGSRIVKVAGFLLVPPVLVVMGMLAMEWRDGLAVERIEIMGAYCADEAGVLKLARVDTGATLFDIEPEIIEDRVRRHAWIREADVSRIPTGTLRIRISERSPVVLVLQNEGTPAYYLDEFGHAMPVVDSIAFDVPLLTGLRKPAPQGRPVEQQSVLELLDAIADLSDRVEVLISEVEIRPEGELWVYTMPVGIHGSLPVRLGRTGYAEKLERLYAFWRQAVLPEYEKSFAWIDLRFDSQIVTEEVEVGSRAGAGRQL